MTNLLFAFCAFCPALIVAVGVPLALGKIPPNGVYGYRTARSLSSPELWYQLNRLAGLSLAGAGLLALAAVCLIWLLLDVSLVTKMMLSMAALTLAALAGVAVPALWGPRS